jgi:hypothetical protein
MVEISSCILFSLNFLSKKFFLCDIGTNMQETRYSSKTHGKFYDIIFPILLNNQLGKLIFFDKQKIEL